MPFHLAHNLKTPKGYNHLFFLLIERLTTNFRSRLSHPRIHKRIGSSIRQNSSILSNPVSFDLISPKLIVNSVFQEELESFFRVVYFESLLYIASSDGVFISSVFLASFCGRATSFLVLPPPSHSGYVTHDRRPVWGAVERSAES